MTGPWILYGANGYTGELVARLAASRGHRPILAGRRADAVCALAEEMGLERRLFSLDDSGRLDEGLEGMDLVLHCAGPFSRTSRPMVDACLRTGTHYLDVTGAVAVFEALATRDGEARAAGVALLPGCGFDVVPTDCLAAHLARRLPTARRLAVGFDALGRISRGTALTAIEGLGRNGLVRRGGVLTPVPVAWKTRTIDFGRGPRRAMTIPWGDVSTAWHSTRIPDIEAYWAAPAWLRAFARSTRWMGGLFATGPVQRLLQARARARSGPSEEERRRGRAFVWAEAEDDAGGHVTSRLVTPEGYAFTALSALTVVEHVLAGHGRPGFRTPSLAFGPDFVLGIAGVTRTDETPAASA